MAIAPNVTFVSGAILTAAQQNAFGFGIVAKGTRVANTAALTVDTVTITAVTFTAIASRNYRITYTEPQSIGGGTLTYADMQIKQGTTTAGTLLQLACLSPSATVRQSNTAVFIGTFSAGATNIVATCSPNGGGTILCAAAATFPAFLIVEDLGPN